MDAAGSNIRVDTRGREVQRILPRTNELVNEEWISDKTRFVWDGLRTQRLDRPYLRENGGRLRPASWQEAFAAIAAAFGKAGKGRTGAVVGDLATTEEAFALKELMQRLGSPHIDCRQDGAAVDPALGRASYLFNATIAGIDEADALVLVGSNPRKEAPVINARIRKRWLTGGMKIALIGERAEITYDYTYLGAGPESLGAAADFIADNFERPLWIVGQGALRRPDGGAILAAVAKAAQAHGAIKDDWNGFSVLHTAASRVGALDVGAVPGETGLAVAQMLQPKALDVLFLLGADEIDVPDGPFVVYIGTHGDRGAHRADVILPGAAYTEKSGIYVNTEGRPQLANRAAFPPGDAREDWAILRALSDVLGAKLPFDSLPELRRALYARHPHLAQFDAIEPADASAIGKLAARGGTIEKAAFVPAVRDFYLTNPIARASAVMAECSALASGKLAEAAE
jgi:NADH-quinone oxidoreductase subunit G